MRKRDRMILFTDSLHLTNSLVFLTLHENVLACDEIVLAASKRISYIRSCRNVNKEKERADDSTNALPCNQDDVACRNSFTQSSAELSYSAGLCFTLYISI